MADLCSNIGQLAPLAAQKLKTPLPYTLLVKGRFWYFRHRVFGTYRLRGEYGDEQPNPQRYEGRG